MRTMKELAQMALDVQNASNLSGVVRSFAEVMTDLRANLPDLGTSELNRHPIAAMFACKVADMTDAYSTHKIGQWEVECDRLIRGTAPDGSTADE